MKNIYKIRKQKGISQLSLALSVDVAQETISAYENGKAYPGVDTLIKLCDVLNVSADYLLDRTDVSMTVEDFCEKNLSADEMELVSYFRKLSPLNKSKSLGIMIGMSKK